MDGAKMAFIPAKPFEMEAHFGEMQDNAFPVHTVKLDTF